MPCDRRATRSCLLAILALAGCSAIFGQTKILVSSNSGEPGGTVSLDISLETTSPSRVAGVQWTFSFSTDDLADLTISTGPAAAAAEKSVQCNTKLGANTCLVAGPNKSTIAAGVLAKATFKISRDTSKSSSVVGLTSALGADADGNRIAVSVSSGEVRILQPKKPG